MPVRVCSAVQPDGSWPWPGALLETIDGDTVEGLLQQVVDRGFGGSSLDSTRVRLRLARINAAKGKTPPGLRATAAVRIKLTGIEVLVTTFKPYKYGGPWKYKGKPLLGHPVDYSGEWMAEITLPDGTNLSDVLVAEGHATYWDGSGPRPNDG